MEKINLGQMKKDILAPQSVDAPTHASPDPKWEKKPLNFTFEEKLKGTRVLDVVVDNRHYAPYSHPSGKDAYSEIQTDEVDRSQPNGNQAYHYPSGDGKQRYSPTK